MLVYGRDAIIEYWLRCVSLFGSRLFCSQFDVFVGVSIIRGLGRLRRVVCLCVVFWVLVVIFKLGRVVSQC